jgi:hypothetical protein
MGAWDGWSQWRNRLPDILPYDPTHPVAYPDNGRLLTDDVADPLLALLTNGQVTEDKVGPHNDLLPEFPYLGRHTRREGLPRLNAVASRVVAAKRVEEKLGLVHKDEASIEYQSASGVE